MSKQVICRKIILIYFQGWNGISQTASCGNMTENPSVFSPLIAISAWSFTHHWIITPFQKLWTSTFDPASNSSWLLSGLSLSLSLRRVPPPFQCHKGVFISLSYTGRKSACSASAESSVTLLYSWNHIWGSAAYISWSTITAICPQLKGNEQTTVAQLAYGTRTSCVATNTVLHPQTDSKHTNTQSQKVSVRREDLGSGWRSAKLGFLNALHRLTHLHRWKIRPTSHHNVIFMDSSWRWLHMN